MLIPNTSFHPQVCQVELGKAQKNMFINPALAARLVPAPAPKPAEPAAAEAAKAALPMPLRVASNKRSSMCIAPLSAPLLKAPLPAAENANPNPAPVSAETVSSNKRQRLWR